MPELKIIDGDRQVVPVQTPITLRLRLQGAAPGSHTVEFCSRSEQVSIDPARLPLEDGATGEVTVVIAAGDRKYTVEAALVTPEEQAAVQVETAMVPETPPVPGDGVEIAAGEPVEAPAVSSVEAVVTAAEPAEAQTGEQTPVPPEEKPEEKPDDRRVKVAFTLRALDPAERSLTGAANLIRDLTQLGYITDNGLSRRMVEELRATSQAVRNSQEKLRVREDAVGDPAVRTLLLERLEQLHGRKG